jgi:hypothetical protein
MLDITACPWPLSVMRALRSRLNQSGGRLSDTPKFKFQEWLVPPVLLPVFIALLVAASAIIHWESIFN